MPKYSELLAWVHCFQRNISNPIVTPVSDEFPTEEQQKGIENQNDNTGKDTQVKKDAQKKS